MILLVKYYCPCLRYGTQKAYIKEALSFRLNDFEQTLSFDFASTIIYYDNDRRMILLILISQILIHTIVCLLSPMNKNYFRG